jgi:hypothetical protein
VIVGVCERKDFTLVDLFLDCNLIALKIMNEEASLISSDVDGLVELSPRCLGYKVVLGALNKLFPLGALTLESLLEVIDANVRALGMVIDDQELGIAKGKLYVLSLNVLHWESEALELLTSHGVENAETKGGACGQNILGVLSNIHRLDGFLDGEDSHSSAIVGVVHADIAIV